MSIAPGPPAPQAERYEPTLSSLMSGIIADVETLMSQQLALLRREVREDVRAAGRAMALVAVGGFVALLGGVALTIAAAYALKAAYPDLSFETSFAIVGGSLAVIGCAMLYGGMQLFAAIDPVPTRSMEALEENVQCILQTPPKTKN